MRTKFLITLLINCFIIDISIGNNPDNQPISPLHLNILTKRDGLSHTQVHDIIKDHEGYIWVATKNGLNQYNSYEFKTYKHSVQDTGSLGDSKVWCLLEDSKNRLWVGTNQGGLNLYNRKSESFKKYVHDPDVYTSISQSGVTCMIEDHTGKIWVGTYWGLNEFDPEKEVFERYYYAEDDPGSITENYITCLIEDDKNRIWVGTKNGLNIYNRATGKFKTFKNDPDDNRSLSGNFIRSIYQDSDNVIWIGTEGGGLSRYNESNDDFKNFNSDLDDDYTIKSNIVRCIAESENGNIWFGTDGSGINIYNKSTGKFNSLQSQNITDFHTGAIYDIYFDDEGIGWVAQYDKGLLNFNKDKNNFNSFKQFLVEDSLLSPSSVTAMVEGEDKSIWIGTGNNGLFNYNPTTKTFKPFHKKMGGPEAIVDDVVKCLMLDDNNNLWVGTYAGGLHKINLDDQEVTHFRHDPNDATSLANDNVWDLHQDRNGRIWIGTLEKGLDEYVPETGEFIHHKVEWSNDSSISSNSISLIYEDSKGRIWVGTEGGGLNLMNKENRTFQRYQHHLDDSTGITNNEVNAIYEDSRGRIWVGTNGGGLHLFNRKKNRFDKFFIKGEKYDAIYGIIEDDNGNLWMSSNNGLYVLNPETRYVKTYNIYDGLQGNQYNYNANLKASDGTYYFGGINGFDYFKPENIKENSSHSKIIITDFYLFHKQVSNRSQYGSKYSHINNTKEIVLNPSQYVFGFKFATLDYALPKNNKYAFKLEGFDPDWNYVGTTREATYTNIPAGEYEFKVKATNDNGVWNDTPLSIKVTILPPWWDILWVQILLSFAGIFFVFAIIRVRTKLLENKKRNLENEVKRRVHQIELQKIEIEDKNEELKQQNEKIWRSHEQIQHQNDELKAKNEEIIIQQEQIKEKSILLEEAHKEIKKANNELKQINADLEKIVDLRTAELKEAMQKLIKSDEELNTFLYRSSHDLRGPITTLLGLAKLAQKENDNPHIDEYFVKINHSCQNMLKVLKKLNETNVVFKSKRVSTKVNTRDLINDLELELENVDLNHKVKKIFNINVNVDIYSDELLLKTIIYNLMENAIIYRTSVNPSVTLTFQADEKYVELKVVDNGLGIQEEIRPHIFKMFYRGSEYSTGNGLGLYLVQKSVELLNGKIQLESKKNEYSAFTITIPNEHKHSVKNLDEVYMEKKSV